MGAFAAANHPVRQAGGKLVRVEGKGGSPSTAPPTAVDFTGGEGVTYNEKAESSKARAAGQAKTPAVRAARKPRAGAVKPPVTESAGAEGAEENARPLAASTSTGTVVEDEAPGGMKGKGATKGATKNPTKVAKNRGNRGPRASRPRTPVIRFTLEVPTLMKAAKDSRISPRELKRLHTEIVRSRLAQVLAVEGVTVERTAVLELAERMSKVEGGHGGQGGAA